MIGRASGRPTHFSRPAGRWAFIPCRHARCQARSGAAGFHQRHGFRRRDGATETNERGFRRAKVAVPGHRHAYLRCNRPSQGRKLPTRHRSEARQDHRRDLQHLAAARLCRRQRQAGRVRDRHGARNRQGSSGRPEQGRVRGGAVRRAFPGGVVGQGRFRPVLDHDLPGPGGAHRLHPALYRHRQQPDRAQGCRDQDRSRN